MRNHAWSKNSFNEQPYIKRVYPCKFSMSQLLVLQNTLFSCHRSLSSYNTKNRGLHHRSNYSVMHKIWVSISWVMTKKQIVRKPFLDLIRQLMKKLQCYYYSDDSFNWNSGVQNWNCRLLECSNLIVVV